MAITVTTTGVKEAIANVRQLPKRFRRKGYRVALNAAGGVYKNEVEKRAPTETGILKKSMRVKVAVPYNESKPAWVKVGPGRGLKQAVDIASKGKKKGQLVAIQKKITKLLPESSRTKYRIPTRYAHLVEGGTKRGVKAQRFMRTSEVIKRSEAVSKMEAKLRAAVWSYQNN